jgi:hypothetical protein
MLLLSMNIGEIMRRNKVDIKEIIQDIRDIDDRMEMIMVH